MNELNLKSIGYSSQWQHQTRMRYDLHLAYVEVTIILILRQFYNSN